MDNLQWRFRARVVACINMLLSIVLGLVAVLMTFVAVAAILEDSNDSETWGPMMIVAMVLDIIFGIQLWTALKLLSATEKGKPTNEALQKSRIWLKVNIILLIIFGVLNVLNMYVSDEDDGETCYSSLYSIPVYVICMIMMFIVYKFIQELKIIVSSSGCASAVNNLDCVYVK